MLIKSQPLSDEISNKLKLDNEEEIEGMSEPNITSQHLGRMFEDILSEDHKRRVSLRERIGWRCSRIKDSLIDLKYTIGNHIRWHKTMRKLRSWEGFSGLLEVMLTHLNNYTLHEEQFGHSEAEYKKNKIASAKATIDLLTRMKAPDEYMHRRLEEVRGKYPEYLYLVTNYKNKGTGYSGDFVAQGDGWVGQEGGSDPREGYFEFVNGRFELVTSPDQQETDRLLSELHQYHTEIEDAYLQAEKDSDEDFAQLLQLLKDDMYSWWD